jgi:hypothetical protein
MLNEFRTRYPNGGLIGELLQIDHGKYIVRVSVQIAGVTVATGLAAADTIEAAEDRARIRAVALLDLDATPYRPETIKEQQTTIPQAQVEPVAEPNQRPKPTVTETVSPTPESVPDPPELELELNLDPSEPFSYFPEPEEAEEPPIYGEPTLTLEAEEAVPHPPAPAKPATTAVASNEPTDYSDVIDRTNVEMKRLGWTNEQGRDYLLSTYGKRSRQLLDDRQLLEFLQHLASLPTP